MVSMTLFTTLFLSGALASWAQEFKPMPPMPDLRGQSFGLENFLMQPFNFASHEDMSTRQPKPPRRRAPNRPQPYNVQYQVHNDDFDLRNAASSAMRPSLMYSAEEPQPDYKPVHEFPEAPLPPLRRRQPTGEGNLAFERPSPPRFPPPDTRRPLEKPSEFMLSLTENISTPDQLEQAPPERQRKRVMKRRRKKPSTPVPELEEPKQEESLLSFDLNKDLPTSYQQTALEPSITTPVPENIIEHRPQRRKPSGNRNREPAPLIHQITPEEAIQSVSQYEDKLISEASQSISEKETVPTFTEDRKPEITMTTTDNPRESTQKLKTLLKQQNGQLSLSELLQTRNLSLADFLKGNPGALSALGANKVEGEKSTTPHPISSEQNDKVKSENKRPHIPKISSKSRPFSKPLGNGTKIRRPSTSTEEPEEELPKKLDIIEVTSDKPTYNGFAPKNPRTRGGVKSDIKPTFIREKVDFKPPEKHLLPSSNDEEESESESGQKDKQESSLEVMRTTSRSPVFRLTTLPRESTISEQRVVPKRFGDYRPKFRIDRRKPTTDGTTEETSDSQETTVKSTETTEAIKTTKDPKNRVRIPFMSVNNPEISVILPNKKTNSTTEKPRTSPVIKDRINLFKRLSSEEKQGNENTSEMKESEITKANTTPSTSTSPIAMTTQMQTDNEETTEEESIGKENSDEIVELLKSGNNAKRLQRILAARNMTVTELLEKRANSSRQPNVTHLFENHTDPQLSSKRKVTELHDNHHPSTERTTTVTTKKPMIAIDSFPNFKGGEKFNHKTENGKIPESNSFDELFVDESIIRPIKLPFDKEEREPKAFEKSQGKETQKYGNRAQSKLSPGIEGKAKHPIPLWNMDEKIIFNSNLHAFPTYEMNRNLAGIKTTTEKVKEAETEDETIILETIIKNQDSNNRLKSSINDILKEQVEVIKEDRALIPPAVKSAIIASGVVMGIALIVFVAIFAACGWKQRQFRLRARSSILNDSLNGSERKTIRRTGTLSPVSFKRSSLYKKSIDFDTESSISGSSNTSSYLWNTLKHTFQSRNSTLKNRQEKEGKIQERENRSRRNTLTHNDERDRRNTISRDDDRLRRSTISRDDHRRDSVMTRETDLPRRNTLSRDDLRRDSVMSRDTLSRDLTRDSIISRDTLARDDSRRSSCFREENRRLNNLLRENERCSFKKIDPERSIIQTSVNFKRGGFNGSSRHFDSCDHFN